MAFTQKLIFHKNNIKPPIASNNLLDPAPYFRQTRKKNMGLDRAKFWDIILIKN